MSDQGSSIAGMEKCSPHVWWDLPNYMVCSKSSRTHFLNKKFTCTVLSKLMVFPGRCYFNHAYWQWREPKMSPEYLRPSRSCELLPAGVICRSGVIVAQTETEINQSSAHLVSLLSCVKGMRMFFMASSENLIFALYFFFFFLFALGNIAKSHKIKIRSEIVFFNYSI